MSNTAQQFFYKTIEPQPHSHRINVILFFMECDNASVSEKSEKSKNENAKNALPKSPHPIITQGFVVYTRMTFRNLVECTQSAKMDSFVISLIYDEKPL